MARSDDPDDPRGLIAEAYKIEGIDLAACRTIFLDWSLDARVPDPVGSAARLSERHRPVHPDHPMTEVLRDASHPAPRGRRGGRQGRRQD